MIRMRFPVFCAGFCPADTYGRVQAIAYGVPVICGGVTVRPGDIVLGDYDGVVIVPSDVVSEVIRLAHDKASTESKVRAALMRGESVKSVYAKYGVM
jgi:regulator of RNase E activity RraA